MEELDSKLTLFAHYDIEYIDNNHVISAYKNLWWDGPDKTFGIVVRNYQIPEIFLCCFEQEI
jgi:hypothetical protein